MGPPQNQQILWGEEPQRNERGLAAGWAEGYEACGDEEQFGSVRVVQVYDGKEAKRK